MCHADLSDPSVAVDTSSIEPYPHQLDDPGADKTIMSVVLIRELEL